MTLQSAVRAHIQQQRMNGCQRLRREDVVKREARDQCSSAPLLPTSRASEAPLKFAHYVVRAGLEFVPPLGAGGLEIIQRVLREPDFGE